MSWDFVYCPSCGTSQQKIGGCAEEMFCRECCTSWSEGGVSKKKSKKRKKKR